MIHMTASFRDAQFAYHEDGRIAMRSGQRSTDPWQDSNGIHHSDAGMSKVGFHPLPNLADALIAQQQTMQDSLDEAVREVSERVWGEGYSAGFDHGDPLGDTDFSPRNPYRKATS